MIGVFFLIAKVSTANSILFRSIDTMPTNEAVDCKMKWIEYFLAGCDISWLRVGRQWTENCIQTICKVKKATNWLYKLFVNLNLHFKHSKTLWFLLLAQWFCFLRRDASESLIIFNWFLFTVFLPSSKSTVEAAWSIVFVLNLSQQQKNIRAKKKSCFNVRLISLKGYWLWEEALTFWVFVAAHSTAYIKKTSALHM